MTNTIKFGMNYGAFLGLILVSIALVMYSIGIGDKESYVPSLLNNITIIAFITYSIIQFKNINNDGLISYKESLKLGTTVAFFSSIIFSFYLYIHLTYINPELIIESIATAKRDMIAAKPEISDEEIEFGLEISRRISKPHWIMMIGVVSGTFMGFLYSLVISIFVKNENKTIN